mmetsp:Transcript_46451/g.113101  ORF Transcript_46451/g.113101 Transcript_46451/m.113101 type:complete len:462 (+) Transcript_46451:58-1443(+)
MPSTACWGLSVALVCCAAALCGLSRALGTVLRSHDSPLPSSVWSNCSPQSLTLDQSTPKARTLPIPEPEARSNGDRPGACSRGCACLLSYVRELNTGYRHHNDTQPLLHFAFYSGQGFGRLLEHSHWHLALATLLERPLVIDLHARDPFYTWRSFFEKGDIDWTVPSWIPVERYASLLPENDPGSVKLREGAEVPPELLPLVVSEEEAKMQDPLAVMRGHDHQILYSPNWGAWYPHLGFGRVHGKLEKLLVERWGCRFEHLQSHVTLFKPTALSHALWRDAKDELLGKAAPEAYGAFHLRFVLINNHNRMPLSELAPTEWALGLAACAAQHPHLRHWVLIGDLREHIRRIAEANVALGVRGVRGLVYYSERLRNATTHSNTPSAKAKFGHAIMAPNVADWMLLRQANVTLLSTAGIGYAANDVGYASGAFGKTSHIGTGKAARGHCEVSINGTRRHLQILA